MAADAAAGRATHSAAQQSSATARAARRPRTNMAVRSDIRMLEHILTVKRIGCRHISCAIHAACDACARAMTDTPATPTSSRGRLRSATAGGTAWTRNLASPVRGFLHAETGGAVALVVAAVVALLWANIAPGSYASVWDTQLAISLGGHDLAADPARLGQPGADDALLPRRRPRGQARARPRRAARAHPAGGSRRRRARRDARRRRRSTSSSTRAATPPTAGARPSRPTPRSRSARSRSSRAAARSGCASSCSRSSSSTTSWRC